ncbi:MAG: alpha/beta hydrolase family protein [bacterium]
MNETTRNDPSLNRREIFQIAGLGTFGWMAAASIQTAGVQAAAESGETPALAPLNRFPRLLQEYYTDQVRQVEQRSLARKNVLQTKAEAEAYIAAVREKIQACFGPFPEKTPLNPRITGVVERGAYAIEKVIFESRPGFLVTANLYLPKGRTAPAPGVVGVCGHSSNGKAYKEYQGFAQGLARLGYAVLIFDPIGQGERLQYPDGKGGSRVGIGVSEHLYAGNQQSLVGEFFGAWRAWDGIRALDYLLTRSEVDSRFVGVTGNSGGGTMTTWLCGVESRWAMAAPSCFVMTFRRNLENELPADIEQCPPKALALELDHDDFIAAMAPKPVILLGQEKDFFDVRGLNEAYARLRRLYGLLEAEQHIGICIGPGYHGYSPELREAMYRWFNDVTHVSQAATEPELVIEDDQTLWCAPGGQVANLSSRTVFYFTREKSQALARTREKKSGEALRRAVLDILKMPERASAPDYRILRPLPDRGYPKNRALTYAVETEPKIWSVVYYLSDESWMSRSPKIGARAVLYVPHLSSDAELREEKWIGQLIQDEAPAPFFACDPRGIGESLPNTCGADFRDPYGPDYFYAVHSLMLDRPYVGQKTFDILRVLDWLADNGYTEVHLAAAGWGAIPATLAALLSERVVQVTLKNALTSYTDIAETESYKWPLSCLLPNVLAAFDLPDCYRELESKKLRIVDPWGAAGA